MPWYYDMLKGSTTEEAYGYENKVNSSCKAAGKAVTKSVKGFGSVDSKGDPNRLMDYMKIMNSPIAIAIDSSYIGITNYGGGVIDGK